VEPHTIDLGHDLGEPHHEGVYGPLLWVDVSNGRVWQEGSAGEGTPELGTGTTALLIWVGMSVAVVSEGVPDAQLQLVGQALRAFLRRPDLPIVFRRDWLPRKIGSKIVADAPASVPDRELARAEAYALVQAAWLEQESVTIELRAERFAFEVRAVPDEAGRVEVAIQQ
jgi:hypothetical protein